MKKGKVFLVGAGPGDVELLTLKAVRAIQQAHVLLVDDLVNREVLQFANPQAEIVWVGKRCGRKSVAQSEIEGQMIDFAGQGKNVVRLKGGDPFIFGRGGEELQSLTSAGLEVAIIPGITSGIAAPATLGIPLTHRDHAHSVTFITGHRRDGKEFDWCALAKASDTLVIYMGLSNLTEIVDQLLSSGLSKDTPAAAIQHGTLSHQKQVVTTLEELVRQVFAVGLESPTLIVIGGVVSTSPHFVKEMAAHPNSQISAISRSY